MDDGARNKMEQVGALKNGMGIQYLLNEAYKILGNPISMFNTEYNLQAYNNVVTDDPIWNELVIRGNFSYETQVLFKEEGFIDAVANTKTIAFLISDKVKYDRISGKLYDGNKVHVANLVMVACDRPFENGDAEAFEAVCRVFSKEISKSDFYQTYGKIYQETYIRKLIDGEIEADKELYAAHIAIVYSGFKSGMRLVAADIGKCDGEYTRLVYFRDLFSQTQSDFEYAIYSKYILIIIDSNNTKFSAKRDLKKLFTIFEQNNIYAGVSSCFDNMYELRKYYMEALDALNYGLKKDIGRQIFLYS